MKYICPWAREAVIMGNNPLSYECMKESCTQFYSWEDAEGNTWGRCLRNSSESRDFIIMSVSEGNNER